MSAFTSRGTCRLLPVSTAINKSTSRLSQLINTTSITRPNSSQTKEHRETYRASTRTTQQPPTQSTKHQAKMAGSTITFPEELLFRPRENEEHTRRARSLSPARPARASQRKKLSMSLTIREKTRAVDTSLPLRLMSHASGITKTRSGASLMSIIAEETDRSLTLARSQRIKGTSTQNTAPISALESTTMNMTVAQRVTLRRRNPGTPFIQRKTRATTKAATKATRAILRRRAASVPGAESLALMDPDEMALIAAMRLQKPQTKLQNHLNGLLPQTDFSAEGPAARTTNNFDDESDEENRPVRESWSFGGLEDEKKRRLKIFNAVPKDHEALHQCDGCTEAIVSTRYECKFCDFDLCIDCYTQPTVTFEHQHPDGETVVR
jgi:hypothetical protein